MKDQSAADWKSFQRFKADHFERLYPRLFYYASHITDEEYHANRFVCDQLYQCWASGVDLGKISELKKLYVAIRNKCIDYIRKREADRKREEIWTLGNLYGEDGLSSLHVEAELLGMVKRWVDTLPPGQQEVIKLIFFEGLSAKEVAGKLGISTSTVSTQKIEGLKKMQELARKHNLPLLVVFIVLQFLWTK
jgi:RNA polymerase sigma-70 factor (ECF subfamily)